MFFVIAIAVMCRQMLRREEYDVSVMYAGPKVIADTQNAEIEDALAKITNDNDGDGEREALFYDLIIMTDSELSEAYEKGFSTSAINNDTVQGAKDAFQLNILSDDHFVLMLSPERYTLMLENGGLERLDDLGAELNAHKFSDYAIKLSDIEFAQFYTAFSVLPDDTLVCFKKISEVNSEKKKVLERREKSIEFFAELVNYRVPNGIIIGDKTTFEKEDGAV
jgi:hypothetical protein